MEKFFINSQQNTNVNDENSAQLHHSRMLLHVKSRQLVPPAIQNVRARPCLERTANDVISMRMSSLPSIKPDN
ncbi:hypothetical protein T09_14992 [Trichinella sp. T9]|nr:hypothetical protein T09_14992 [Trichinella sp. T9]